VQDAEYSSKGSRNLHTANYAGLYCQDKR